MTASAHRPTRRTSARKAKPRPHVEDRLLAAMERLLEKGHKFGALTVEQLAEEAGIARATFYLHFRDMAELVARLMGRMTQEIVASGGLWFENAAQASREDVHRALRGIVATFKKHQAIVVAIAGTASYDPTVADLHAKMMDELCNASRRAIATVRRSGKGSAGATPQVADVLTWMVELYSARFIAGRDNREIDRLVDTFAHICASAIFADGGAPARSRQQRRKKA